MALKKRVLIKTDATGKPEEVELTLEQMTALVMLGCLVAYVGWGMSMTTLRVVGNYRAQTAYAKATRAFAKSHSQQVSS